MEDHQLVERSRAGDLAAFEELVKRHQGRAYAIAYRLLGNREDAQEVAQEAFARAYFRLAEFRGTAQFRTWLYRILVNLATDLLRRRRPGGVGEEVALRAVTTEENPGESLDRRELRQGIQKAIGGLPADLRTVIVLRELEGLSYSEIARVIRRPMGTVMSRLFHARRRLQQSLAPFWQGDSPRD
jgi:RNA polymerase sigma-70 factor (ECF subfamily)